jgi:hypothetical protein
MAARIYTTEEKVRRQTKQIAYSIRGVTEILAKDGTFDERAKVRGITGTIRIIIRARTAFPEGWAMAILLDNDRIDGIDWERVVKDHRGKKCSGWHRHIWKNGDCKRSKECLPQFNPQTTKDFILEGFKILNVKLGRSVRDDRQLSFH